jgi:hypothetical protein
MARDRSVGEDVMLLLPRSPFWQTKMDDEIGHDLIGPPVYAAFPCVKSPPSEARIVMTPESNRGLD